MFNRISSFLWQIYIVYRSGKFSSSDRSVSGEDSILVPSSIGFVLFTAVDDHVAKDHVILEFFLVRLFGGVEFVKNIVQDGFTLSN